MKTSQRPPDIDVNFHEALIERVTFGPRREFALLVAVLSWEGTRGVYVSTRVRFGGVEILEAARQIFRQDGWPYERKRLAAIECSPTRFSRLGHLFIDVSFYDSEARMTVECRSLSIER